MRSPRGHGPGRLALIVGTEGAGLTPALKSAADAPRANPDRDGVDSLNVAVAAGIALYRLRGPIALIE